MSKRSIDLKKTTPVFMTLVEGQSSLADAYVVANQVDEATEKVKGASAAVFGVMRYNLVQLYSAELKAVGDDPEKMNLEKVAGQFLAQCAEVEESFDYSIPESRKRATWKQAKSDLKTALEAGFPFYDQSTVGQSAMNKWKRDKNEAEKRKQEEELRKQYGNPTTKANKGPVPSANPESGEGEGAPIGSVTVTGLDEETQAQLNSFIEKLQELASVNPTKVTGVLKSAHNQVDQSLKAALKVLASGNGKKAA
jgi:hypothetical protein